MDKIKEALGEDLFKQVSEKLGDKKLVFDTGEKMIPKARFDEVIQQRDSFKEQLETVSKEIDGFKGKIKDADELKTQIDALTEKNNEMQKDFEVKLKQERLNAAVETALIKAKAKNPATVKALLKMDAISLDGDNVIGLNDQLEGIIKNESYLFGIEKIEGGDPEPGGSPTPTKFGGYESKTEWVQKDPKGFAKAREAGFK